jgi:hypothetical protein
VLGTTWYVCRDEVVAGMMPGAAIYEPKYGYILCM